jgi:hypothetical protein
MLELRTCASNFPASASFSRNPCDLAHLQIQSGIGVRCVGNGSTIARKLVRFVSYLQRTAGPGSARRRHSVGFGASASWSPPDKQIAQRSHRLQRSRSDNGHRQVKSKNLHRGRNLGHDRHLPRTSSRRCPQQASWFRHARRGRLRRAGRALAVHQLRPDGPRSPCSPLSPLSSCFAEIQTIGRVQTQLCPSFQAVARNGSEGYAHILEDLQGQIGIVESEEEACDTKE